ncbi:MAG: xylulose kinase [Actinobacteria bacterium]|nr:xylulose kinase [Actinomycetota bacterium]
MGEHAPVTVGIDIGTSSVKAVAADDDGNVVARARVPHRFRVPTPGRFEHDVQEAWRDGPRAALAAIEAEVDRTRVRGVSVAAMVPSLGAVDATGAPLTPGLLYGDERGRRDDSEAGSPAESGELRNFARWCVREAPTAVGLWPAQAVANHELAGEAVLDTSTAATAAPLFDFRSWDAALVEQIGARVDQLPRLVPTGWECGRVDGDGPPLASGCIDAFAEQLVAGADAEGDVLVIFGTTLIVWAVTDVTDEVPGYWVIPHTASGKMLVGGPSNAGGLFADWARRMLGDPQGGEVRPDRVPVWAPYPRGERVPLHDPYRRAALADLDLTHDGAAVRRATYEASGFVTRRVLDTARAHGGLAPKRIVATGGGIQVDEWLQAVADATALPVECVAVPEGGALGSAWLARIAGGLEEPMAMTEGRRWARRGRTIEPDPGWLEPVAERYERFLQLSVTSLAE